MKTKINIVNQDLTKTVIESIVDGPGIRLTIFFQGCEHKCKNCHNPSTWDKNKGYKIEISELIEYIVNKFNKGKYYSGITISGGDALFQKEELEEFLKQLKEKIPNLNIWLYTGFHYEEILSYNLLKYIDTLVDGPYIDEQRNITLKYRGSENQRIINLR